MKTFLFACFAVLFAGAALSQELSVPLTVREPAGVERKAEPVSGGIPLPKEMFKKGQPFALFEGGKEIPLQISPLVVDNDGYLRWVLVDTQVDLKAGEAKTLTLKAGKPSIRRPEEGITITKKPSWVLVQTGRMGVVVYKNKPFTLTANTPADVSGFGRNLITGAEVSYVGGFDGKRYVADKPSSIDVEYAGPMRATVCVKGRFIGDDKNRFQYIARITAWAGKTCIHVKYSIANSNPDHYCYRLLKESSIRLKLNGTVKSTQLGAGKPIAATANAALEQHLHTRAAGNAKAISGGEVVWKSAGVKDIAQGWIAAKTAKANVYVCDLYFAHDPARRVAVENGQLVLGGVITREKGNIEKSKDRRGNEQTREIGAPFNETRRMFYDCSHLSSQYVIDFDAPDDPAKLSAMAQAAREQVWLQCAPEWYLHSDHFPFGKFATQKDEVKCYDTWGWKYDPKHTPTGPQRPYPRYYQGTNNHYTPEEDVIDQLVIMYLRTGRRAYFQSARSWANYFMDRVAWRTNGWKWKDGGVWWYSGPKGNAPQRPKDPVTGLRNYHYAPWVPPENAKPPVTWEMARDLAYIGDCKTCYCHNWAAGIFEWYLLTGERDALEAGIDRVEQDYDTQSRPKKMIPGQANYFSRGFNRSAYNAQVARMVLPQDAWVRKVSDYFWQAYVQRPTKEPRGLVNGGGRPRGLRPPRPPRGAKNWDQAKAEREMLEKWVTNYAGRQGLEAMRKAGVTYDFKTGKFRDTQGRTWFVLESPHTWMFPPLSRAYEAYHRVTGNEDAMDWVIAYGQAAAHLLFQDHTTLHYGKMLADFPKRGVVKDYLAWVKKDKYGTGITSSGFLARFHPDVCARAYSLSGEPFLKQRALDFWRGGSHRGYNSTNITPMDRVARWVNFVSDHDGQVDFVLRTFYIYAYPRKDAAPPEPIKDLKVTVNGDRATVTFTAPTDAGGKVARYQVKCSDRPIVSYEKFLEAFNKHEDAKYCNWWMATNLAGEPNPQAPGARESVTVTGVPANAKYFAVRSFDDSSNRSAIGNVAAK